MHGICRCSNEDTVFLPTGSEITLENVIEQINVLKIDFSKKIDETKNEIIQQLRSENEILKTSLKDREQKIANWEKDMLNLQQYNF